ncbi:hypothetical protein MTR_2g451420 [Medicago truncatula]|uniref:Uncharacterized protein n=1 Tax=Medicago truncatula TaxID=3880 RepID=A0A072V8I9_MEDTR|nr:hypothetical protein MTR_2g451420 [Medicago truncatula]
MVKSIEWGEVAPALITSTYYKRPSRCCMLEPIIEEEPKVILFVIGKISNPLIQARESCC